MVITKRISVVSVMTRLRHGRHSSKRQRSPMGPSQPSLQCIPEALLQGRVCGTDNADL